MSKKQIDKSKVTEVVIWGIDPSDYPDFTDAYIASAEFDGEPMDERELNILSEDAEFVRQKLIENLRYD